MAPGVAKRWVHGSVSSGKRTVRIVSYRSASITYSPLHALPSDSGRFHALPVNCPVDGSASISSFENPRNAQLNRLLLIPSMSVAHPIRIRFLRDRRVRKKAFCHTSRFDAEALQSSDLTRRFPDGFSFTNMASCRRESMYGWEGLRLNPRSRSWGCGGKKRHMAPLRGRGSPLIAGYSPLSLVYMITSTLRIVHALLTKYFGLSIPAHPNCSPAWITPTARDAKPDLRFISSTHQTVDVAVWAPSPSRPSPATMLSNPGGYPPKAILNVGPSCWRRTPFDQSSTIIRCNANIFCRVFLLYSAGGSPLHP